MKRVIATRLSEPLNNWIERQARQKERSLSSLIAHYCEIARSADLLGKKCVPPIHIFREDDICTCGEKVSKNDNL